MTQQSPFPETSGRTKGYEPRAVDAFLEHARGAFERRLDAPSMTSDDIRRVAFPLTKHGYDIIAVDAALARIEDAFAARERDMTIVQAGASAWVQDARTNAQEILDRLRRPARKKFRRAGFFRYGYRMTEVDLVAQKLVDYFQEGKPLTAAQVRSVAFKMQRNGYAEEQVDALLDAVVDVMLAVAPAR